MAIHFYKCFEYISADAVVNRQQTSNCKRLHNLGDFFYVVNTPPEESSVCTERKRYQKDGGIVKKPLYKMTIQLNLLRF